MAPCSAASGRGACWQRATSLLPRRGVQAAQEQAERTVAALNGKMQQLESQLHAARRQAPQQQHPGGAGAAAQDVKVQPCTISP